MFLTLFIWACSPPPQKESLTVDLRPRVVETQSMTATGHANRRFPSQVQAIQDSWLASETGGRVESIDIEIGQSVSKGQVLLRLNADKAAANLPAAVSAFTLKLSPFGPQPMGAITGMNP